MDQVNYKIAEELKDNPILKESMIVIALDNLISTYQYFLESMPEGSNESVDREDIEFRISFCKAIMKEYEEHLNQLEELKPNHISRPKWEKP